MSNEIYSEVKKRFDKVTLFDEINITLRVKRCDPIEMARSNRNPYAYTDSGDNSDENRDITYMVLGLDFNAKDCTDDNVKEVVHEAVGKINHEINVGIMQHHFWNVFYVYKELFQLLVDQTGYVRSKSQDGKVLFNYFRGQTVGYDMVPGIFRNNINSEYVTNFDKIYRELCNDYPSRLKYVGYSIDDRRERVQQLSLLQHYGLRTSLIDITRNPFIALEFMTDLNSCEDWDKQIERGESCGRFEMYAIDEEIHSDHNIFLDVIKSENNKRLIAQKGAFFCYDYLTDLNFSEIKKIPRIIIDWKFDKEAGIDCANQQIEKIKQDSEDFVKDSTRETDGETTEPRTLMEYLKSMNNSVQESLKKANAEKIKALDEYKDSLEKPSEDVFEQMFMDVQRKLSEYFYFRRNLFPDLDKYIEYLKNKYEDDGRTYRLDP